ncbi:MAG TPA: hypothetical protein VH253_06010 [Phycisphaerae bacterium]|nr:hypothetical protein [Phycisphaerae bacterium]
MKRVLACLMMATMLMVFLAPGRGGGGRGGGGGGRGGGGGGGSAPRPQVNPAIQQDQTALASAQSDLNKAQAAIDEAVKKQTQAFQSSDDYKAAQKAVDDATAEVSKTRDAALTKLKGDPSYKTAAAREDAANKKVAALQAKHAAQDAIDEAAKEALDDGGVTTKMENAALDADSDYAGAKQKLADATKALADMKKTFQDGLKDNADLATLYKARDDAQTKVTDAQNKLRTDAMARGG